MDGEERLVLPEKLVIGYETGHVEGKAEVFPHFCVGSTCTESQDVLVADEMARMEAFEGLLGLELPAGSANPFGSKFVSHLMQQGMAFSVSLAPSPFLALGHRHELLQGLEQVERLPVHRIGNHHGPWAIQVGLSVGGQDLAEGLGVLDTGATGVVVMPEWLLLNFLTHLLKPPFRGCNVGEHTVICKSNQELHDLRLKVHLGREGCDV